MGQSTRPPGSAFGDLRGYLAALEERGWLHRITAEVDWDLEIGAIQREVFDRQGPALLFEKVRDSNAPLVSGLMATPDRYALGVGSESDLPSIVRTVQQAAAYPIAPVRIGEGLCQEVVVDEPDIDLNALPVPRWHELDGGRYIGTLGVVIMADPETGAQNLGIYREQITGRHSFSLNATQQAGVLLRKYRNLGRPMPVATVIGVDPATLAASCIHAPLGTDETGIAGALLGRPQEVVRCVTSDLLVPASAEYVLEGEILPDAPLVEEGPFGEYSGYYGAGTSAPEIRLKALTHRRDPIFQGTLEGAPPSESTMLRVPGATAGAWALVRGAGIPGIRDIHLTDMGCASYFAVVSLEDQFYFGHAREVVSALWAGKPAPKWIVLVDSDIDVYDRGQVEWAMATRVQPHRDIWVTPPNQRGIQLDPAIPPEDRRFPHTRTSRVAIDATVHFKGYEFEPLAAPGADLRDAVMRRWDELGLPR